MSSPSTTSMTFPSNEAALPELKTASGSATRKSIRRMNGRIVMRISLALDKNALPFGGLLDGKFFLKLQLCFA